METLYNNGKYEEPNKTIIGIWKIFEFALNQKTDEICGSSFGSFTLYGRYCQRFLSFTRWESKDFGSFFAGII